MWAIFTKSKGLRCTGYLAALQRYNKKEPRFMQTYLKTKPGWMQLLLFFGMAMGVFLVFSLIGVTLLSSMTGIHVLDVKDLMKEPIHPRALSFIRGMLLIQFLGLFVIPSLLFAYFSDPKPGQYLGFRAPGHVSYWVLGIVALLVSLPFVELAGILNQKMVIGTEGQAWMKQMEEEAARQIQFMVREHTPEQLILNLIFIALFAGVGEELFFRGILQRLFIRITKSPWAGILLTALIFSAFHMQFYGFIPRFLLGALLGAIYWYSGSIWPAILAHFLYDALIIVVLYLNPEMVKDPSATLTNVSGISMAALVSLALTVGAVWLMKRNSRNSYVKVYHEDEPTHEPLSF